ncbi:MAG: PEP-CTERM sorting domain-containing protein [Verrucomicrobiae bacterium]|nr:PEP-CTERM sorting domain-containing protein [Verrucomicrobiae bacterium]
MNAHGALVVSNLDNAGSGSWIIGGGNTNPSDTPIANSFTTGPGAGWTLDGLTLSLSEALTVSGSISIELFSDNSGAPGTSLAVLSGPDPSGSSFTDYTYTPGGTVTLAAATTYWVVASGPLEGVFDTYAWERTSDTSESFAASGWSIGDATYEATTGTSSATWGSWSVVSAGDPNLFSVSATAVPEPSGVMLVALSGGLLVTARRRRRPGC